MSSHSPPYAGWPELGHRCTRLYGTHSEFAASGLRSDNKPWSLQAYAPCSPHYSPSPARELFLFCVFSDSSCCQSPVSVGFSMLLGYMEEAAGVAELTLWAKALGSRHSLLSAGAALCQGWSGRWDLSLCPSISVSQSQVHLGRAHTTLPQPCCLPALSMHSASFSAVFLTFCWNN